MNILIEGYLDRNFGDDMMIRIAAYYLKKHKFFISAKRKEVLEPFKNNPNINIYDENIYDKIDFILRVTGSGFFIKSKRQFVEHIFKAIKNKDNGIPKGVIGCNIGPFFNKIGKFLIMRELKQYSVITVREKYSESFLDKKKITGCYPDILFAMPDSFIPETLNEGCLGISAYRLRYENNIDFYKKMAFIADKYIEKTGNKVIIFAFDIEDENDLCAAYTIKSLCSNKDMVEIVAHDDNGDNIVRNFIRCEKIIGVRFHSCILAMRLGIDFVPIMYSDKTAHVLEDLNYTGKVYNMRSFKSEDIIEELFNKKSIYISNDIREASKQHFELVEKYIKGVI